MMFPSVHFGMLVLVAEYRYTIQTTTHTDSGATMQDTVILYLYGRDGCSGPLTVGSGRDGLFKPGATDEIKLGLGKNIGKLYKLRIGLAEEQPGYEWHLEKLKLQEQSTGEEFDLDVSRWMSRKKEDCDIWRELPVSYFDEPPLSVITYTVEVHTSGISGADTEAPICINLIGHRGDSGKRKLYATQTEGRMFSQGKIDIFTVEAVSLGAIKSIIIGHSERKPGQGWHLSFVAVKEYNLNDEQIEIYFPCNRWFDTGQEDQKTERELLPGEKPSSKPKSSGEYHMWVATADDSQPANEGKATLVVYGDKGHSGDIDLFAPNSTAKLFEPANTDEFEVSTGDIGNIYKIRITREDKTDWKAWHLEEIKLEDKTTGEVFTFHFDRWLSRDMEDGDLSREQAVVSFGKDQLTIKTYEVLMATGDHWAAGTDANVYVTLFGSKGDSGRRVLHRSRTMKKIFQRGQEDTFTIEAVDLEELKTVMVGHDGHGPGSGWFLKDIIVTDTDGKDKNKHMFPCGKWLDEGEVDGKIERTLRKMDLPKLSASKAIPGECGGQWKVKVKTSDMPDAGTQAQVYITIHGTKDYSNPIPLGNDSLSKECFTPGKESTFDVTTEEIGELAKIRLEHDSQNKDAAWHVDWVWMKHLQSGFEHLFIFNQWLADDGEDRQVFRECAVESPGWMPSPLLRYIIIVQTGRKPNSGAHGGMCTINIMGSQGVTGQQKLSHPLGTTADCMKDGMRDVYMLEAVCVGEVRNVRVGFDGRSKVKRWFVESVTIMESLLALSESVFIANTWLDTEKHRDVVLPLSETVPAGSLPRGMDSIVLGHHIPETEDLWDLWIQTGNEDSAGTHSVVVLVLCGTTGSSPPVYLNQSNELHTGSHFHTQIKSGRIGEVFKIRLAIAEKTGNSWFLGRIKLKDCVTKQEFIFDYNSWLHCTEDSQYGTVELPAIRPDISPLPESTYKVCVVTGDLPCAETSAEIILMIIGLWGDSGQHYLTKSIQGRTPFSQGQTDEFELKLLNLGKIFKILLGHNEYGRGHGWFCQQVSITDTDQRGNKMETVFACNRWLDTGVDDRQTTHEFSAVGTVSLKDVIISNRRVSSNGIWTCYIKIAGTDKVNISDVNHQASPQLSLTVYGSQGNSGPLILEDRKNGNIFPGQTCSFKGLRIGDVGDFLKLRVSYGTNDDTTSIWAIEKVLLEDSVTGEKLWFDFNKYVGEMSAEFSKELPVIRPAVVVPPLIKYIVRTETSSASGAGTAAKVYVTIYGQKGDSGYRLLHTNGRATQFRQGEENVFEIEAVDLGKLEKVVLTKGSGDPWLLKQMVIKAGLYGPVEYIFMWNKWIGSTDKRDQEVETTMLTESFRPSNIAAPISGFPDFPVTRGQWTVDTYTGPTGLRGEVTDITVIFCGSKRESNPVSLNSRNDNPFQPDKKDIFEVSLAEDVGELIKMRLGFEDNSKHKKWHLQKIKFEDNDTKDTFWFAPSDGLSVSDVSDGYLDFPVIWPGIPILPTIKYTITIEAGDVPEAALREPILVKLDGEKGSTGYRSLKERTESQRTFQQGQTTMKYVIEVVSLMRLNSITIGHTNSRPGSGWYLFGVIVEPNDEKRDYVFLCNRWLDSGQDDGETIRTLYYNDNIKTLNTSIQPIARIPPVKKVQSAKFVHEEDNIKPAATKPEKAFAYEITTVTGKEPNHGTTAQLVIVLYGDKGHSEPLLIEENGPVILSQGSIHKFQVSTDTDLGDLYKLRIGFNAAGHELEWYSDTDSCPTWFTEMIKIKDINTTKEHHIETDQWVRIEDEQDFWREFPIKRAISNETLAVRDYLVDVYTGNITGAGTNANVYIQIFGQNGDSGLRHLHSSKGSARKFEMGSHDMFTVKAVDLGKLSKVKVKHDGRGAGSGWYLDNITVRESQEPTAVFLFDCNRWLDEGEDDRAIERELTLTDVRVDDPGSHYVMAGHDDYTEGEKLNAGNWHVSVTTSSQPGSGTDSNVFLTVFGDKGHTEPFHLTSEDNVCFKPGMVDHFDIWMHPDIGEIKKVRLEHDNSGTGNGWRVDKLEMENQFSGEKYMLNINRFLSYDEVDGDIVYECSIESSLKAYKYIVKVVTESEEDAGTEATVYINIIGSQGDSGKRFLKRNVDTSKMFASGKTNVFLVEAVDLGDLDKIVIGHDGVGPSSSWKLQCVMIRAEDAENTESCVFPCGKWLTGTHREVTILKGKLNDDDDDDDDSQAEMS